MAVADARDYRPYRSDLVLDVRQIEVALRKLRAFHREGAELELDLDETIDETAKNAGELEIVLRPPRKSNVRVLLLMDVGGSMDPHAQLVCAALLGGEARVEHPRAEDVLFPQLHLRPASTRPRASAIRVRVRDVLDALHARVEARHRRRRGDAPGGAARRGRLVRVRATSRRRRRCTACGG